MHWCSLHLHLTNCMENVSWWFGLSCWMYKIEDIDKTSAAASLLTAASLAALLLAGVPLGAALQGPAAGRPACRPAAAALLASHKLGVLFCTILYCTAVPGSTHSWRCRSSWSGSTPAGTCCWGSWSRSPLRCWLYLNLKTQAWWANYTNCKN